MRYFDDDERTKKERLLALQPQWVQKLFRRIPTVHDVYDDMLAPYVSDQRVALDAGCGRKGIMNKYSGRFRFAVGADLSPEALKRNSVLDAVVAADLASLPFADEVFDVIISQWAVEHIADPAVCFREFYRVLKPGGGVILVTNSILNPLMFFSAIFPAGIRDRIKERLLPPEIEEDTFPTYYRCNTLRRMRRVLSSMGFVCADDTYVGDASFFIFSRVVFPLLLLYEKVTDIPFLRCFKMHVVVHYRKT